MKTSGKVMSLFLFQLGGCPQKKKKKMFFLPVIQVVGERKR